ncbi:MAG: hypothetical protein ACKOSQ_05005 [Planctomycetaceae bacterium]
MLTRVLIAAWMCGAVAAPSGARAGPDAVPIVIGEGGDEAAAPVVIPTDGSATDAGPAQPPPVADAFVVEEMPEASVAFRPGGGVTCQPCAPAAWETFTTVDALFIDRENSVGPLAVSGAFTDTPGATVIGSGNVRYPMSPGGRIFQTWRKRDCLGFEVGYLGVSGMHAEALAVSPAGDLAVPGVLGIDTETHTGFGSATAIRPVLNSTLNSAECNLFTTRTHDGCQRHDPLPWRRVGMVPTAEWLVGLRYAYLDESANLEVTAWSTPPPPAPVSNTTSYRVTTSSQLFGPQIGHRRRIEWGPWAVEGWAKAGLMASVLSQAQSAILAPADLEQIRDPRKASTMGVGMIGDLNATIVRRLGDHWGVRAGYTLLWLTGVAPAASQWDFTNDSVTSGTGVAKDTVFLHGASLGLEASW